MQGYIFSHVLMFVQATESRSVSGKNVGSFVQTGGQDYKLATDNCRHAATRMTNLGDK